MNNTPLHPHHQRAPSQEGNFVSNINLPNAGGLQPSDSNNIEESTTLTSIKTYHLLTPFNFIFAP
jgi:hypothetical protein